jgi:hypothetical protein
MGATGPVRVETLWPAVASELPRKTVVVGRRDAENTTRHKPLPDTAAAKTAVTVVEPVEGGEQIPASLPLSALKGVLLARQASSEDVSMETAGNDIGGSSSVVPVGTKFAKQFSDQGVFVGTVARFDAVDSLYHVTYSDGDEEDLDKKELELLLQTAPKSLAPGSVPSISSPPETKSKDAAPSISSPPETKSKDVALSISSPLETKSKGHGRSAPRVGLRPVFGSGDVIPLGASAIIGRGADADIRLDHPAASRSHARIDVTSSQDLRSENQWLDHQVASITTLEKIQTTCR